MAFRKHPRVAYFAQPARLSPKLGSLAEIPLQTITQLRKMS